MSENPALTAPPDHATTTPVLEVRAITRASDGSPPCGT
jgi:hypothetical protein